MKNFVYFEMVEGGMEVTEGIESPDDLSFLYRWMDDVCRSEDEALSSWMETAMVGQLYPHRLGYLVRLMDT
jgi:hypothetical protein